METSAPATELHQKEGVGINYQFITDNEETELRHRNVKAGVEEEIEGEEERGKTKQKCKVVTSFGESGNQITGAVHEKSLIKNGNYSVNKWSRLKGKVKVKEKGKGETRPVVRGQWPKNLLEVGFTAMAKVF